MYINKSVFSVSSDASDPFDLCFIWLVINAEIKQIPKAHSRGLFKAVAFNSFMLCLQLNKKYVLEKQKTVQYLLY